MSEYLRRGRAHSTPLLHSVHCVSGRVCLAENDTRYVGRGGSKSRCHVNLPTCSYSCGVASILVHYYLTRVPDSCYQHVVSDLYSTNTGNMEHVYVSSPYIITNVNPST